MVLDIVDWIGCCETEENAGFLLGWSRLWKQVERLIAMTKNYKDGFFWVGLYSWEVLSACIKGEKLIPPIN